MAKIMLYDTTLRDGGQTEGISFSVEDKIKIARRLDEMGVPYIEGGWPAPQNRTDTEFFRRMAEDPLSKSKLVAFGSTRRADVSVEEDPHLASLLEASAPAVAIVGKTWDLHVRETLKTSLETNLKMIEESIAYCKKHGLEVIFDAEHFFDGYQVNPEFALKCLQSAEKAGADVICLCDTNGGALPDQVKVGVKAARKTVKCSLGIHAHNDGSLGVANSLAAVAAGATHVQATFNGYGERCGNADLCAIAATLQLKMDLDCLPAASMGRLYEMSHYIAEIANMAPFDRQPFVGRSAFAHKAGYHLDGVLKRPDTYEHISPESVGNQRRLLISDQAGGAAVVYKARGLDIDLSKRSPQTEQILQRLKEMEHEGYQFEGAEASFELLLRESMGLHQPKFELDSYRVLAEKRRDGRILAEAVLRVIVDGEEQYMAAEGDGPVHALDNALRKALERFYPGLEEVKLTDFKVRVVNVAAGTAAKVRVLVESSDDKDSWSTVGVHENIIEASWQALSDGVEYGLLRQEMDSEE
ncbi:MAG: citramalate synthase [Armatimonadetes bacterium]|nr:citramalate synthase [Armatimonadota bacterium]NIM22805.1 citramalate synthase [Armatimonadota bacterium]NIM66672.1 citramalate synthase [Armatimonadota bacterium]NIM75229.1 citramalate synthase [Armatimonadota bacterium]NIN04870.1 citramalate synthase [Armatimonadota bacterium]